MMKEKEIKQTIFNFLWEYNYIYNNDECECPFRKATITFKNRVGKKFDRRLLKYAEVLGFEATSGPIFDLTILPESKEKLNEIKEMIEMKLKG